jgi:hypothetical protein
VLPVVVGALIRVTIYFANQLVLHSTRQGKVEVFQDGDALSEFGDLLNASFPVG